jgi:hypothetical protein
VALSRPSLTQPSCDFKETLTSVHPVSSLSCCSQEYASTPSTLLPSGLRSVAKYTLCVSWAGTTACKDEDVSLDSADGRRTAPTSRQRRETIKRYVRLLLTRLISRQQVTSRLTYCDHVRSVRRSGPPQSRFERQLRRLMGASAGQHQQLSATLNWNGRSESV